jgi:hypothetical protein
MENPDNHADELCFCKADLKDISLFIDPMAGLLCLL